jgi:hypothetical protein
MNIYITIGYAPDGNAKVISGPELSYKTHKDLLRKLDGKGYERAELWSRSSGKIKQRRLKPKADKKTKTKSETDEKTEKENEETNNEK